MNTRPSRQGILFFSGLLLAAAALTYGASIDHQILKITDAKLVGPASLPPAGGRIVIRYTALNPSTCATEVDVAIRSEANGALVWRHRGPATGINTTWLAEVYVPPLSRGRYSYLTTFRSKCSERRIYTSDAPDVPIEVK